MSDDSEKAFIDRRCDAMPPVFRVTAYCGLIGALILTPIWDLAFFLSRSEPSNLMFAFVVLTYSIPVIFGARLCVEDKTGEFMRLREYTNDPDFMLSPVMGAILVTTFDRVATGPAEIVALLKSVFEGVVVIAAVVVLVAVASGIVTAAAAWMIASPPA